MYKNPQLKQLEEGLQSVKDWHSGKVKLRTWEVDASGNRRMFYQSYEEYRDEKDA
jgi:hypothetical protein